MNDSDASLVGAACVVSPRASPVVLNPGVDPHADFTILVDPAALALSDGAAAAQDVLFEDPGPIDLAASETAAEAAAEALESLTGEIELGNAKVVEPEPSPLAIALGAMARPRPTILSLGPDDCRFAIDTLETIEHGRFRNQHLFCGASCASGRPYCAGRVAAAYEPPTAGMTGLGTAGMTGLGPAWLGVAAHGACG